MKVERVLPEPHRYAVCACEDVSIKNFYKDVFNEVYIFFHPFIKPLTIDSELFYPESYPDKFQIINHCEILTWKEFLALSGMKSYEELDIGLRTRILGLNKEYENKELKEMINSVSKKENLIPPTEGMLPELLINKLLGAIKKEKYDWIWVGDEFGTERKLEYIDDLIDQDTLARHNLFTHDNSILITTHWDSHFSMICSDDKKKIDRIIKWCNLEGFYCDDHTEIYWSVRNSNKE
ncbi:DUF2711 family protein [Sutcliffiella horikoshii]|uniref:DUF2711 family protein n=1 Tax=Sutcliffiella horikoshii TaxID=79883 RepID=A0A5D4SZJ5_9BACI|nr:DUF2711 family protein [Sutcliffiella horikoshii]TYS68131.1 DUF2711 family protein [Sutcliffiella horikoshii]